MKILVINYKNVLRIAIPAFAIALIIFAVNITGMDALGVFSPTRELPIYYVETAEKQVAITFDCAWGADDIPQILEVLKDKKVKATFFIVGQWAEKFPEKVKMISEAGHDVANHSYSHLRMGAIDLDRLKSEIQKGGDILQEITGKAPDLFRPPYGDYNNSVITTAIELGYYTIQWNVDSLDWKPGISKEEIMSRITSKLCNGSIVLFHNDTTHTASILPNIIDTVRNLGFEPIPVSQMIIRNNYFIDFDGCQKKK